MTLRLDSLRRCFEGAVPAVIATVAVDGTPNVALLSQVHYIDRDHVALTFQFFNKTRANILVNPHAMVQLIDPLNGAQYRLRLQYLHTETEGALFERMKAKLAGIASHTGMSKVFRLLGADVYRVVDIQSISLPMPETQPAEAMLLATLRECTDRLNGCQDLTRFIDLLMRSLQQDFGIEHGMLMMYDKAGERLFTVASFGYATSGIGSEIPLGAGVVGVAAKARTPIRIGHMTHDYSYSRAVRASIEARQLDDLEMEIPFPGLESPDSQLAIPVVQGDELLGVLHLESTRELFFDYLHEDALVVLAGHLATAIRVSQWQAAPVPARSDPVALPAPHAGPAVTLRRYPCNNSVFIEDDYLIKGVAGAIFWRLVSDFTAHRRTEFSNRELRLDPSIGLPEIGDNLEARLILLQKRLDERCDFLRIEKTGRGRFRLRVDRPITLHDQA